jgi:hypothetical protein
MSCTMRHRWKKIATEPVGKYHLHTFACRGCAATKTEYHLQGERKMEVSEETSDDIFKALQLLVVCVMLAALVARCGNSGVGSSLTIDSSVQDTNPSYYGSPDFR